MASVEGPKTDEILLTIALLTAGAAAPIAALKTFPPASISAPVPKSLITPPEGGDCTPRIASMEFAKLLAGGYIAAAPADAANPDAIGPPGKAKAPAPPPPAVIAAPAIAGW